MAELDLSKAIEAGARAAATSALTPAWWKAANKPLSCATDVATDVLTAALPHILDALASEQEAKAAHLIEVGSYWAQTNVYIAEFLRAKAAEAHHA